MPARNANLNVSCGRWNACASAGESIDQCRGEESLERVARGDTERSQQRARGGGVDHERATKMPGHMRWPRISSAAMAIPVGAHTADALGG
jgi:hypothetical protein